MREFVCLKKLAIGKQTWKQAIKWSLGRARWLSYFLDLQRAFNGVWRINGHLNQGEECKNSVNRHSTTCCVTTYLVIGVYTRRIRWLPQDQKGRFISKPHDEPSRSIRTLIANRDVI